MMLRRLDSMPSCSLSSEVEMQQQDNSTGNSLVLSKPEFLLTNQLVSSEQCELCIAYVLLLPLSMQVFILVLLLVLRITRS
ncbi:unnamed protein product [Calypogeia fissa]